MFRPAFIASACIAASYSFLPASARRRSTAYAATGAPASRALGAVKVQAR